MTDQSSAITPSALRETLRSALEATHVEVKDISGGCGTSFNATVVSPQFTKKTSLARHRLVNGAIKAQMADIHAWTCRCLTLEEWEKQKQAGQSGEGIAKE
ncbi:MAG: hypothetical protein M1837_001224 [Sclerophora amabilis]|nr:MAG: hypothetical protein M1837_001224 [Sclerophora amabilis]